jgi:hypothetical protein
VQQHLGDYLAAARPRTREGYTGELTDATTQIVTQHSGVTTSTANSTNNTYFIYWLPYIHKVEKVPA